ncbi:DDE-type integrase/transposase/recombinase [Agaribacter flavus]|uniref:DDE-type integrase/transposase/recombinase n=1 Tax=Agaribacter flavus TaxID=1902781 RepID=A0ABV7FPC4_9ALTE
MPIPSLDVRLRVLAAVDVAPGASIRARIVHVSQQSFVCPKTDHEFRFTWRTISTWLYRYKKDGITTMEKKTRSDKTKQRKVQVSELAEAITEVLPSLSLNKVGKLPKSVLYQVLLERNYFTRAQLAPTTFYHFVREHELIKPEACEKLRMAFAMLHANELWQGDTMHGPAIRQADGSWKKTYFIAFIDDASRLITHGECFYADDTKNMINAFRSALYKRGKPERLYFDNGSNYTAKEIHQACLRLDIRLTHAPVRDGAAKGEDRSKMAKTWSHFRSERRASGRPGWLPYHGWFLPYW